MDRCNHCKHAVYGTVPKVEENSIEACLECLSTAAAIIEKRRKIVEAFQLMKDICTARGENCDGCPLMVNYEGDCIGDWCRYPHNWEINDSLEGGADWRALK